MNLPLIPTDNADLMLLQTRWKSVLDALLGGATASDTTTSVPTGTVWAFAGATVPDGWLLCDGRDLPKLTYPDLAAALGTTWGSPTNTTNFRLPALSGRTLIGSGTGSGLTARTLGTTGGAETHVLSVGEMPSHAHSYEFLANLQPGGGGRNLGGTGSTGATQTTGGDGAHNNMQPWAAVQYIIKT